MTDGWKIRALGQLIDLHSGQHPDVQRPHPVAIDGPQNEAGEQREEDQAVDHHRHHLQKGWNTTTRR